MRRSFGLPIDRLGFLLAAVTLGYLVSSFSSGRVVARFGLGRVLAGSSALVAASLTLYVVSPAWGLVILGGVLAGLGAGAIDAGINAYAASCFTAGRVSWLHACWGIGAALGPLVMTGAIASGFGWRWGYSGLAVSVAALGVAFHHTRSRWDLGAVTQEHPAASLLASLRHGPVQGNMALFFWYVGLESGIGQWAYSLLTESRRVGATTAGIWVSAYWASLTIGRMLSGVLADRLGPSRLLRAAVAVTPLGAGFVCASLGPGADVLGLVLMGLGLAPVFPLLIAGTPRRVGPAHAGNAVGFQVSVGSIGAALLPGGMGFIAQRAGVEAIAVCWLASTLVLLLLHEGVRATTGGAEQNRRPVPGDGPGPTTAEGAIPAPAAPARTRTGE
jgi:fucose permease